MENKISNSVPEITPDILAIELKKYLNTMYISKNKDLKRIIKNLSDSKVVLDKDLYGIIQSNRFDDLDEYIKANPRKDNFFKLLEQFFLFYYFLPEEQKITRKQFQNAMGIQQVRWMVDDENCKDMAFYTVESADFVYWNDIDQKERQIICKELIQKIGLRFFNESFKTFQFMDTFLKNTIWYKVIHFNPIRKIETFIGSWAGYGSKNRDFFPIPETLNFSKIACIYTPRLVFGSLSDKSLFEFIVKYKQRPYIAHIPNATSNLCVVHELRHSIVAGWMHDFHHSRSETNSCNDLYNNSFRFLNDSCKMELNEESLKNKIEENDPELMECLAKGTETYVRGMNDTGSLWHSPGSIVFEGGKRPNYKKKSTRRRKNKKRNNKTFRK
jgi:hypothetical protein